MAYKLIVTEHADELLDNLVYHLVFRLKNKQAAGHLIDGVDSVYERLKFNPFQFPVCRDIFLAKKRVSRSCCTTNGLYNNIFCQVRCCKYSWSISSVRELSE